MDHIFYSGPAMSVADRNHSSFVRRSIIQSPSMRNFDQELYQTTVRKIPTIYEVSPVIPVNNVEIPTQTLGMTTSPSMRALESIINEKTQQSSKLDLITESEDLVEDANEVLTLKPPVITNHSNNQSHASISSFHTAKSANSEEFDYTERQGLLGSNNPFNNPQSTQHRQTEDELNDALDGQLSPGINNAPIKARGLFSPNVQTTFHASPEKQLPSLPLPNIDVEYTTTLDPEPIQQKDQQRDDLYTGEITHQFAKPVENVQKTPLQSPPVRYRRSKSEGNVVAMKLEPLEPLSEPQLEPKHDIYVDIKALEEKKNRRKSFAGFFKTKKSVSSNDLLLEHAHKLKHKKSKSSSKIELVSNGTNQPQQIPKSKSKLFSAFKRKHSNDLSTQVVHRQEERIVQEDKQVDKQEDKQEEKIEQVLPPASQNHEIEVESVQEEGLIKELDLFQKGHAKRNSILVPSPVLDIHQFDEPAQSNMLKDLSFSASMISSINHNYDIINHSDIEEKPRAEEEDDDEFNSSFNSIKKSYSGEIETTPQLAYLPRDISVGSLRLNLDDYDLDDYTSPIDLISSPMLSDKIPVQKLQHHAASSKIQNLLGEALFPKSLDINEVQNITTLERSRSMRSVKSVRSARSSLRDSLIIDGMTVVKNPGSPIHEPMNSILSSPSSILKRRSADYDDDLQEFAKMIDFGDYDDDSTVQDFSFSIDLNLSNFDQETTMDSSSPIKKSLAPGIGLVSPKPLPQIPSDSESEKDQGEKFETSSVIKAEVLDNPFDYPYVEEEEDQDVDIKEEESEEPIHQSQSDIKPEEIEDIQFSGGLEIRRDLETDDEEFHNEDYLDTEGDDLDVKIKQEDDFDEDFNDYNYDELPVSEKSPIMNVYMPNFEENRDTQRPMSMSVRGLKGPKFGETNNLVQRGENTHSMYMPLQRDESSLQFLQTSSSRLNLNEKISKSYLNTENKKVSFSSRIILFDTYHEDEYDRHPEIATCNQLTPFLAQRIKEELNQVKSEMEVHESSRCYTQFF